MKKYDALYIFVNTARDDAVEPLLEKVSGDITRLGGRALYRLRFPDRDPRIRRPEYGSDGFRRDEHLPGGAGAAGCGLPETDVQI